jgi:signal transduction histidine kinase
VLSSLNRKIDEANKYIYSGKCDFKEYRETGSYIKHTLSNLTSLIDDNFINGDHDVVKWKVLMDKQSLIDNDYSKLEKQLKEAFSSKRQGNDEKAILIVQSSKSDEIRLGIKGILSELKHYSDILNTGIISSNYSGNLNYLPYVLILFALFSLIFAADIIDSHLKKFFRDIVHAINELYKENYGIKINKGKNKALKKFYSAFNQMSENIARTLQSQKMQIRDLNASAAQLVQEKEIALLSDRAKSKFLASISHEIRTPLTSINGSVDLLKSTKLDKLQIEYLKNIQSSSRMILDSIDDILDMARIDQDELVADKVQFNLEKVIFESFSTVKHRLSGKNLRIYADIHRDVPYSFIGDPALLKKVLINLLDNSVKFTKKGEISITVESTEQTEVESTLVSFSVKDPGIGIP